MYFTSIAFIKFVKDINILRAARVPSKFIHKIKVISIQIEAYYAY